MANASPLAYHPAAFGMEEEFLEELRKKSVREGEEGLMLAILEDAIACFRKYVHARDERGKALFRDAEEWILEQESEWIFSFENICDTLRINASYLRQGLIRWKEKELACADRPGGLPRSLTVLACGPFSPCSSAKAASEPISMRSNPPPSTLFLLK